jgi:peptidoglycan/xylan/chitin deacetylase (PgdA/CDA1 family)
VSAGSARRLAKAALGWALRTALRLSSRKVGVALLYHSIEESARRREDELVPPTPPALFERQLDHLGRRYRVVPASRLQAAAAERRRGRRIPLAITFDDDDPGYRKRVAPALRRAGLTATFLLNGGSLERPAPLWWRQLQAAWDRGAVDPALVSVLPGPAAAGEPSLEGLGHAVSRLPPAERARVEETLSERVGQDAQLCGMAREEVRELAAAGFEIGFHTVRHDYLPVLDDEELHGSVRHGRVELAEAAGAPLEVFAYPNGGTDERVRQAVEEAGFRFAFTTVPEPVTPTSDPLALGRVTPPRGNVAELSFEITRTAAGRPRGR